MKKIDRMLHKIAEEWKTKLIRFYKRFIDDIFIIWTGTEEDLKTFMIKYVGQSGRSLHDRIREHMYSFVKEENAIGIHFNSKGHNHLHMKVTIVEKVIPNTPHYRLEKEDFWIKTVHTKKPKRP